MKSILTLFVLISMLVSVPSHAQFMKGYGLKFGAVNANQTWTYSDGPDLPTDARWGFDVGGYVEVVDIPYVSALAEVHYVQKGFLLSLPITTPAFPDGTGELMTLKPRLDYLSVQLLGKIRFESAMLTPYILAGPRFDILIGRKDEGFQVVLEKFKSVDVCASIGAGIEIPFIGNSRIAAEFNYSPSFTNSFDNGFLKVKNKSMELLVGIGF